MKDIGITGMGVISTAGIDLNSFWQTLLHGENTYHDIEEYVNNKDYRFTVGARIKNKTWQEKISPHVREKYCKASQYAVYTVQEALKHAGISNDNLPDGRTGIVIGSTMGEIQVEEEIAKTRVKGDINSVNSHLFRQYRIDNIGTAVREFLGVAGPTFLVPAACAAGNYAIALGKRLIEDGMADIVVAGGVDVFSRVAFTGFQRLLSLTPDVCRPFSVDRKGLVVGEGCGIVILETLDSAKARGVKIWGRILGIGLSSDGYHMTAPHPNGEGAVAALKKAFREAQIENSMIDYISAHGTGTPTNDKVEVKALTQVFGQDSIPPTSSIKSMLGHAMGAASVLELIASLQMMEYETILPTVNYLGIDPNCPIDCVPNQPRKANLNCILSNSYAFGGQNSSIIVKKDKAGLVV